MKKDNLPEIICFFIFCAAVITLSFFHEPWFDEFQAWGISKDSIFNILFVIPHLEGHPPLWHLILKCFSFFNVNCELGIKIPNLLFMFGAVWLLIFKSPFPRIIKLALPFTYFIFYQYSIISRPYSIFCFAIFLAAYFYKERNEHPFKFISALALLCLSCAYGMVISTGIIIAWFIEIIRTKKFTEFFKDKRFFSMLIIFMLCSGLALIMIPDKDVLFSSSTQPLSAITKFFNTLFILPSEALFFDNTNKHLMFLTGCLSGLIINIISYLIFKEYKKLMLFFIPYLLLLSGFYSLYVSAHHIGLLMIFYIFVFWCILTSSEKLKNEKLKKLLYLFTAITIIVQLYWSICASINEIKYPYFSAREISKFIKDNKINNYKIMAKWLEPSVFRNKETGQLVKGIPVNPDNDYFNKNFEKLEIFNIHGQNICSVINPYFNRNIFYSFNAEAPKKEYVILKKMTKQEAEYTKQKIREKGLPDFILNQANLYDIFTEEELKNVNYGLLREFSSFKIQKDKIEKSVHKIYIREDLYNKLLKQKGEQ